MSIMRQYLRRRWVRIPLLLPLPVFSRSPGIQPFQTTTAAPSSAPRPFPNCDSAALPGRSVGQSGLVYNVEKVLQQKEAPSSVVYLAVYFLTTVFSYEVGLS